MRRSFRDTEPDIAPSARVDDQATVIGNVTMEAESSVWPGAVLRSDAGGEIRLRSGSNVQDNAVCHADAPDQDVVLGPRATIGHSAIVHNATVGDHGLVGMNATVLDEAVVEDYAIVAAGSVVTEGSVIRSGTVVAGTPASVVKEDVPKSSPYFEGDADYIELAKAHRDHSTRLD